MTEAEWLASCDPRKMLEFLRGKASERKLRLFACACCRRIWPLLNGTQDQRILDTVTSFADGLIGASEMVGQRRRATQGAVWCAAEGSAWEAALATSPAAAIAVGREPARRASMVAVQGGASPSARADARDAAYSQARLAELHAQCHLLRDIIGNPFRPVAVDSAWRTPLVSQMGQALYSDQFSDESGVLADALEEAGCTDPALLSHLRSPGPHVRGCWAVDLLLGKE